MERAAPNGPAGVEPELVNTPSAAVTPVSFAGPARATPAATEQLRALQPAAGNAAVASLVARRRSGGSLLRNGSDQKDVLPAPVAVNWASDPFTLSFARTDQDGGRFEFVLTYNGPHPFDGVGVTGNVARVSVMIGPQKLNARVTRNDATTVSVDLYGDGSKVVKVVDTALIDDRPPSKGREHQLSAVDLGRAVDLRSIWVRDPKASPTDIPAVTPEEHPGSNPESRLGPGGSAEIVLDGDGDQHKELKVTIRSTSTWDDTDSAARTVSVTIVQLSTGETRDLTFALPKPDTGGRIWPFVKEVTDGKAPTRINLVTPLDTRFLEIRPPSSAAGTNSYVVSAAGSEQTVTFPVEEGGLKRTVTSGAVKAIGNIFAVDLTLGAYNDSFRMAVEPLSDVKAVFSIATLYQGTTKGGFGTEVQIKGPIRYQMLDAGPTSVGIDLDGDGKADLTLYDRLTTPTEMTEPGGGGPPEANRDHQVRVVGAVASGEQTFTFHVREGLSYPGVSDRSIDHTGESSQTAVDILSGQSKEGATFQEQLDAYEMAMMPRRRKAAEDKVITQALYDAWYALSLAMIKARPQVKLGVPAALQAEAVKQTQELTKQAFEQDLSFMQGYRLGAFGSNLPAIINSGNWELAFSIYQRMVSVLDDVLVDRLKSVQGEHSKEAEQAQLLSGRREMLVEMSEHAPVRVMAVFHPDEKFRTEQGYVGEIPLVLYAYQDGDKWHLRDVTNPSKPWHYKVDAKDGETKPPWRLLTELDDADHFPVGVIHYEIAGDRGGRINTTGGLTWKKFFTYAGLALGAAALALAAGPESLAVYASWAFAGSAAATATAAGIDLVEKSQHGQLDAKTVVIDLGMIASSLMGVAALRAGMVVKGAAEAAQAGAPLAGSAAEWAVFYGKYYLPLRVGAAGTDLIVMSVAAAQQMDEIENGTGTPDEKARAKMLALAQLGALAGLQVLQIKGELGMTKGRDLELYFPREGAEPLAIPRGMEAPTNIKFSQKDVAPTTGDGTMTIDELTESMRAGGWKGDPIDVVEFPDERGTVSIDNRRLLAAERAGLKEIPMRYHAPQEPFNVPQKRIDEGFVLDKNIRRVGDDLVVGGTKGEIVFAKGTVPQTWEEAALFRTANQGNLTKEGGGKFPLWGRTKQPIVREPKTPAPAGGE